MHEPPELTVWDHLGSFLFILLIIGLGGTILYLSLPSATWR